MIENSAPRPQLYQQVRSWNTWLCSSPFVSWAPPLCRSSTPSLPHPVSVSFQHIPLVFVVVVVVVFLLKFKLVLAWLERLVHRTAVRITASWPAARANVAFISNGFIHHSGLHVLAQSQVYGDQCGLQSLFLLVLGITYYFDLQSIAQKISRKHGFTRFKGPLTSKTITVTITF